jgi:Tfp pilus assembly protein PilN
VLRTNLSTRPFYNERAVHAAVALAALIVLAITVLNVVRVVSLSRLNTELVARTRSDQAEAARLTKDAAAIRKTIDRNELDVVVAAAREANSLIEQRTFSWTEFFNQIERTLPPDVMLTAVRPKFQDGITEVSMGVLARRAEDVNELMKKLEATGSFEQVIPAVQDKTDEGLYRVLIEGVYTATSAEADSAPPKPSGDKPIGQPKTPAPGGRR